MIDRRPAERLVGLLAAALMAVTGVFAVPVTPAAAQEEPTDGFAVRPEVAAVGVITPDVRIHGGGWGHGVGLSQFGAYAMALDGATPSDILTYYYPGTEVSDDDRSSVQRIRVGLRTGTTESAITALDAPVTWQACDPEDLPALNGRVPAGRCTAWFEQPAGQRLRVKPLPSTGAATENGTQTHVGEDFSALVDLQPAEGEDPNGPIAVPNGGVLIERQEGANWIPHRAYATPDDGRGSSLLPVVRAVHGDGRIEAQSADGTARRYAFGWRDLHLVGQPIDTPDDYLLAVVQDVDTVERYLRGLAEVPASWPDATLQAQAIAGRTYAMRGSRGGACRCDRLATPADQVYIGESKVEGAQGQRWADAVAATADRVLTYQGDFALTFYSSSHGGRSENIEDSWAYGTTAVPYLRSVEDPYSADPRVNNSRATWTATSTNAAMASLLSAGQPQPIVRVERLRVRSSTDGGTPREVDVSGVTAAGERVTFTTTLEARYAKGIAGAAMRRHLVVQGGAGDRLFSSQITRFGFAPFIDDDGTNHEYAITWAYEAGIVRGVGDDRFAPRRSVTRAQMASYLVNTFAIPPATLDGAFTDVPPDATHRENIDALVAAGITAGFGDGTYGPDRAVTRAQMATFLAKTLGWVTEQRGTFSDVSENDVHGANIEAIAERGVTTGCDAERYCGGDPVQRGQLATFLQRVVLD